MVKKLIITIKAINHATEVEEKVAEAIIVSTDKSILQQYAKLTFELC